MQRKFFAIALLALLSTNLFASQDNANQTTVDTIYPNPTAPAQPLIIQNNNNDQVVENANVSTGSANGTQGENKQGSQTTSPNGSPSTSTEVKKDDLFADDHTFAALAFYGLVGTLQKQFDDMCSGAVVNAFASATNTERLFRDNRTLNVAADVAAGTVINYGTSAAIRQAYIRAIAPTTKYESGKLSDPMVELMLNAGNNGYKINSLLSSMSKTFAHAKQMYVNREELGLDAFTAGRLAAVATLAGAVGGVTQYITQVATDKTTLKQKFSTSVHEFLLNDLLGQIIVRDLGVIGKSVADSVALSLLDLPDWAATKELYFAARALNKNMSSVGSNLVKTHKLIKDMQSKYSEIKYKDGSSHTARDVAAIVTALGIGTVVGARVPQDYGVRLAKRIGRMGARQDERGMEQGSLADKLSAVAESINTTVDSAADRLLRPYAMRERRKQMRARRATAGEAVDVATEELPADVEAMADETYAGSAAVAA